MSLWFQFYLFLIIIKYFIMERSLLYTVKDTGYPINIIQKQFI